MNKTQPPPLPPDLPVNKQYSRKAVAALVMAIVGILLVPLTFGAIVVGHIARNECKNNPDMEGKGLALAGLIIGYLYLGFIVLCTIAAFFTLFWHGKNTLDPAVTESIKWAEVKDITDVDITDVIFHGSQFVASTNEGHILTSTDGVNWSDKPVKDNGSLNSLASNESGEAALAVAGKHVYLFDGSDCWQKQENVLESPVKKVIRTTDTFIGSTDNGVLISPDGITWKRIFIEGVEGVPSIHWCDPLVVLQSNGIVKTSTNGQTWETLHTNSLPSFLIWKDKQFAASLNNDFIYQYQDTKWKRIVNPASGMFSYTDTLAETGRHMFAFGTMILWTSDGITWGGMERPESLWRVNGVAEGNGRIVLVANNGFIMVGVEPDEIDTLNQSINSMYEEQKLSKGFPEGFYSTNPTPKSIIEKEALAVQESPHDTLSKPVNASECLSEYMTLVSPKNPDFQSVMKTVKTDEPDISGKYLVLRTLEEKKMLIYFDWEAGEYPVPYEWFVKSIAYMAQQQQIDFNNVSVSMASDTCTREDEYRISWTIGNNSYGIHFSDESDWYSNEVFDAIELSMIQEGLPHRFINLDPYGDFGAYTLGNPATLKPWVTTYFR